jgi:DNA-binding transcriptional MerR regulator
LSGLKIKNHKQNKIISVKDIINKYHISYQTVNHYTDLGLISVALKKGNTRFYDADQVRKRLSVITRLASEGYSLYLIRRKLLGV